MHLETQILQGSHEAEIGKLEKSRLWVVDYSAMWTSSQKAAHLFSCSPALCAHLTDYYCLAARLLNSLNMHTEAWEGTLSFQCLPSCRLALAAVESLRKPRHLRSAAKSWKSGPAVAACMVLERLKPLLSWFCVCSCLLQPSTQRDQPKSECYKSACKRIGGCLKNQQI